MPFKSKAQMRKMFILESKGELKKGTAEKWVHKTDMSKLPDKVRKGKSRKDYIKSK